MICYLINAHVFTSIWTATPDLTASAPGHTNTPSTRPTPAHLNPALLKHSSIWFIIKEHEVYDELSLFYVGQQTKKTFQTDL